MNRFNQSGFTLLEVLIAITITAIIGVGASQVLSSATTTQSSLLARSTEIKNLQRLDIFLRKDFSQLTNRQARNTYGDLEAAITNQGDNLIDFSYSGVPIQTYLSDIKQSNILRAGYALRTHDHEYCQDAELPENAPIGNCLVRLHWPVLDATSSTTPIIQILVDDITDAKIYFRGLLIDTQDDNNSVRSNEWQDEWPPLLSNENMIADLVQIKLTIETASYGDIERVFEVPRFALSE
jgi:general secretion pathway protein J